MAKIVTAQIIIGDLEGEFNIEAIINPKAGCRTERILVVQDTETEKVETIALPLGKNSLDYISDKTLNGGNFANYTDSDDLYCEPIVADRTEANIVLNKLVREAREDLAKAKA